MSTKIKCCRIQKIPSAPVFYSDAFSLQIFIKRLFSQILSESRLLESSKRRGDVRFVVGVDEASSGVDFFGDLHRLVNVFGEDTGSESELGRIGSSNDAVDVAVRELGDDHDRAEALLLCDPHVIFDVREDSRLHEEPWTIDLLVEFIILYEFILYERWKHLLNAEYSILSNM